MNETGKTPLDQHILIMATNHVDTSLAPPMLPDTRLESTRLYAMSTTRLEDFYGGVLVTLASSFTYHFFLLLQILVLPYSSVL